MIIYTCSNCGGRNVQKKAWIDPNTGEILDMISEESGDSYCDDCEDHYELEKINIE